ncbi:Thioredoxin [hydrothermal vent metagenome]|uniref:Thioredoxin n=1 Tax=hydrothermal vent metagenome TaxID=652676 RepID=A0A3B1E4T8_9ZZZZ
MCFDVVANTLDIDKLLTKNTTNKPLLIFFHMDYCLYCLKMKNITLKNHKITTKIKKSFIFVYLNVDHVKKVKYKNTIVSNKSFLKKFDINLYPTVIFVSPEDDLLYTARGFRNSEKFLKILKFIETKSYEDLDFYAFDD